MPMFAPRNLIWELVYRSEDSTLRLWIHDLNTSVAPALLLDQGRKISQRPGSRSEALSQRSPTPRWACQKATDRNQPNRPGHTLSMILITFPTRMRHER